MQMNHLLIFAALFGLTAAAVGQDHGAPPVQAAANVPTSVESLEIGPPTDQRDFLGADSTAINMTLPREFSSFKMSIPESNRQKQAWCVHQSQVRPEGSNLFRTNERLASGCFDGGVAVSGRDLLIYSAVQLTVRQVTSFFAD